MGQYDPSYRPDVTDTPLSNCLMEHNRAVVLALQDPVVNNAVEQYGQIYDCIKNDTSDESHRMLESLKDDIIRAVDNAGLGLSGKALAPALISEVTMLVMMGEQQYSMIKNMEMDRFSGGIRD